MMDDIYYGIYVIALGLLIAGLILLYSWLSYKYYTIRYGWYWGDKIYRKKHIKNTRVEYSLSQLYQKAKEDKAKKRKSKNE